jgi:hypothetical protein
MAQEPPGDAGASRPERFVSAPGNKLLGLFCRTDVRKQESCRTGIQHPRDEVFRFLADADEGRDVAKFRGDERIRHRGIVLQAMFKVHEKEVGAGAGNDFDQHGIKDVDDRANEDFVCGQAGFEICCHSMSVKCFV